MLMNSPNFTTYSTLGLPIKGQLPVGVDLPSLTCEEAHDVLLGKVLEKSIPNTNLCYLPNTFPGFNLDSGIDNDALLYTSIAPNHDKHNLNVDSEAKTQGQCWEEADYAFMDGVLEQPEEDIQTEDPIPPYEPILIENESSFATSTLQSSLAEPANSSQNLTSTHFGNSFDAFI